MKQHINFLQAASLIIFGTAFLMGFFLIFLNFVRAILNLIPGHNSTGLAVWP